MLARDSRNRWLDILRALAIVLVVNCHIASVLAEKHGPDPVYSLLGLGGHGVDLFFILSGWLLGNVLLKELEKTKTVNVGRFFKRRWLRTLPAYYAVLLLSLGQAWIQGKFTSSHLSYVVFLQRYLFGDLPTFGVSWSLCVEEHFYLLIAPLVLWFGASNFRAMLVFAVLLIAPQVARAMGWYESLQESHVRLDQCAAGVVLAFIHVRLPNVWQAIDRNMGKLVILAGGLLVWAVSSRVGYGVVPPLVVYTLVSCVAVMLSAHGSWWANRVSVPGAYYVATRSYSMYLIHVEAIAVTRRLDLQTTLAEACVIWALTFALAEVLYRAVELPFMKMREKKRQTEVPVDQPMKVSPKC